jgi:hypothetical protein
MAPLLAAIRGRDHEFPQIPAGAGAFAPDTGVVDGLPTG